MKFLSLAALVALLTSAGCGGAPHRTPPSTGSLPQPATPFACHPKAPAQAGECIRQELEARGGKPKTTAPATSSSRYQGIDISRWQPHPAFRTLYRQGIRFVIVQGADNTFQSNPYFDSQVRGAHEAHMKVGVYIFAEGGPSNYQAAALVAAARGERRRITLGAWVDAEVPSSYAHTCGVVAALRRSFYIVGVYGSPGTYQGGRCAGSAWPASWGTSLITPLPGYFRSAVVVHQWCGTCYLAGNSGQIDRDEDLGLMGLPTQARR